MTKIITMNNLTLIIPAKKEHDSLPIFLKELQNYDCKKLIVLQEDDLQTINSIYKDKNIEILFQKRNGYGAAITEGLNFSKTEYSCIINADGSMNPSYLHQMLKICVDKDFIFASRYMKPGGGSEDDTLITKIGNYFFTFLGNFLYKLNISDILFTYILGKTSSFKNLNLKSFDFRLCIEIPVLAKKKKFLYSSIPCHERKRIAGFKKVNEIKDGFLILCAIFRHLF